jgi:hypothetical protein
MKERVKMAKYLITWEADEHLWPVDSKEQGALSVKLGEMVQRAMKEGKITDWGIFIGGDRGYIIAEGNAAELYAELQQFHPYMDFLVHQVLSLDEAIEAQKSRME